MIGGGFYIKAKKTQHSEIMHAPPHVREIWDWLLMNANFKDSKKGGLVVKRGQILTSYKEIQEALHWKVGYRKMKYSRSQIETATKWYMNRTMITTAKTTRGFIITILNYDKYQDIKNYENHNESDNETDNETTPYISRKNIKNKRNKHTSDFAEIYAHYVHVVQPLRKTKRRCLSNLKRHSKNHSFSDLKTAVENYASTLNGSEPRFRKDPANFFGVNEPYFEDYLPENFDPPGHLKPPKEFRHEFAD